jgi:hypothetical protein
MGNDSKSAMKTTINLAQKERRTTGLRTVLPAAIVLAALIALFCKFGVIDQLNRVSRMDMQTGQTQQLLSQVQEKTANYNSVKEKYEASTAAQAALVGGVDPMSCLTLIENNLMDDAAVSSLAISGDTISVKLSNVTLNQISVIYTRLKASSLVSGVKVYTAQTGEQSAAKVTATMTIQMVSSDSKEAVS